MRISKERSDKEDSKDEFIAFCTVAEKQEFRGLGVTVVDEAD